MTSTNDASPTHEGRTDDLTSDDAGTDADVDPGLVVPSSEDKPPPDPAPPGDRTSTNRTGLTPDSIQVD